MTAPENTTQPTVPEGFRVVDVSREPVELYKILKFENLVGSGAEAKAAVASGYVLVNGSVETRKRKQIVSGDVIEFGADKILVRLAVPTSAAAATAAKKGKAIAPKRPATRKALSISSSTRKNTSRPR